MKNICIIGGGPAGFHAAVRSAQLGGNVVLIEKEKLGGVCLHHGCIPIKSLSDLACSYNALMRGGVVSKSTQFNIQAALSQTDSCTKELLRGMENIVKTYPNIQYLDGEAIFENRNRVSVRSRQRTIALQSDYFIIATGTKEAERFPSKDPKRIFRTSELNLLESIPKHVAVIGAGFAGIEVACLLCMAGSKVTVFELQGRPLPSEPHEISKAAGFILSQKGIRFLPHAAIVEVHETEEEVVICFECNQELDEAVFDLCVFATGREPDVSHLNLKGVGIKYSEEGVETNAQMQTNFDNIYCAGDATGAYFYAYVAAEEGVLAAESIFGNGIPFDYAAIPRVIFSSPEIAYVGMLSTDGARGIRRLEYPLVYNGKASALNETTGFIRVFVDSLDGTLLGGMIVSPYASELISFITFSIRHKISLQDFQNILFFHPSILEALKDLSFAAEGKAIYVPRDRQTKFNPGE